MRDQLEAMADKYRYAADKLFIAVEILATGTEDIYIRLADAHSKCLSKLGPRDIPAEGREGLNGALQDLPKKVTASTLRKGLSIDKAIRLARVILTTYGEMLQTVGIFER